MSSPPIPPSSQQRPKRPRSRSRSPTAGPSGLRSSPPPSSLPPSSLPPSSPPIPFSDFGDEQDIDDDEAEVRRIGRENGDDDEDEEGEDLFNDDMMADYEENAGLDTYSQADLDDRSSVAGPTRAERLAAERAMDLRDRGLSGRRAGRRDHMPAFLQSDDDEAEAFGDDPLAGINIRRRRRQYDERMDEDDVEEDDEEMSLEHLGDVKAASIAEWVSRDAVRRAISKHFKSFLMTYVDAQGNSVYGQRIKHLGEVNSESLEVSYIHLANTRPILAYFLANSPQPMLELFDQVALDAILLYYPSYDRIHSEIHVRITELPTSLSLRDLRQSNLNCLVRVSGVVTRRSGVFPQLKYVKFDCQKCGATLGPFYQDTNKELKISFCQGCESRGPFVVNSEQTVYRNYQKMTLQESPGSVPAGRLPRHREVILLWDLIDMAKPGEEVEITGIYRNNFDASLNTKNGFPVFSTVLEANHINKKEDLFASVRLTEEDEKMIRTMARDDRIAKRIIKSIAPSIYGHDDIKTAIALSLFGGVGKDINRKHRVRGDINVLLLGDPGTAKSQFLKYVEKTANRAVFTTGQGASAVGLTASVRKDPITKEWTLEGGALVLADKGHCLIDEFDKMNDADRTSIHEAMEQQSISISKAGIITTLQARCAIIAAANPIRGRYNPTIPFQQNVELTEPILSRFDVLCVVKDAADPVQDEMLAQFVVGSHLRSHPLFDKEYEEANVSTVVDADIIPQDVLRKYIMYAKEHFRPQLHQLDQDKLARLYADLRRESLATGSFPITVRHLESMIRMAEASAKMHLREYVRSDDIDLAIQVAVGSFVNAQKMSIKKTLERGFRKYVHQATDHEELLSFLLGGIVKEKVQLYRHSHGENPARVFIKVSQLEGRAKELEIYDVQPFLRSRLFSTNGYKVVDHDGARSIEKAFTVGA
ncbi:minichromosome maintenance protein 2 [Cryptococcus deuterogattii 99/473]|uniref:DNA replication licensing factor MCM2 n=1 Tax=Cryptococcus deuterogattii Ram5 TaxID=1296110 RepID=A0A0D0VAT8_9TREE|nr:minichromosome maintenance protein 2 [Cryptococcus deuterogattii Ram5]KIY59961.1 minichromosome maintenance protein 2 [Cryptococcus deuterogattii 99/473]